MIFNNLARKLLYIIYRKQTLTNKKKELDMKSDCIWVATKSRRKKEIVDEAICKVMACYGSKITDVTVIQSQFKHNDLWHSHVWYNYETIESEATIWNKVDFLIQALRRVTATCLAKEIASYIIRYRKTSTPISSCQDQYRSIYLTTRITYSRP